MASDGTGSIYIPLEEFWSFVQKYGPKFDGESVWGVPRVVGEDLVIDYAYSSEAPPQTWKEKPPAVLQWEEHRKAGG
jgi:hypothetical protein